MYPDEVRMLDNRNALILIRGERPVLDRKSEIMKHPNVKKTEDGGMPPYRHGRIDRAIGTISIMEVVKNEESK